jgi:hypothetical protein
VTRHGEENAIAIDDFPRLADEEGAVGIAIEGHAEASVLGNDALLQALEMERTAGGVDIAAIRRYTHRDNIGAERAEKLGAELEGGAVGAVQNDAETGKAGSGKNAAAKKIEIFSVERFVGEEKGRFFRGRTGAMLEDVGFKSFFDGVRELHARVRKKLYAVVLIRIVGSGNDHAGLKIILADEAGDAGRGNDTSKGDGAAGLRETRGEESGDVRAGFSRVHADENVSGGVLAEQISGERTAGGIKGSVVERRSAGDAADAVGSEKFFGHERLRFNS